MPEVIFEIHRDLSVPMAEQAVPGHNRWHPDIPVAATVRPGSDVPHRVQGLDRQPGPQHDDADDIRDMNLDPCHMLSGPFAIEGAEPGDLLVVDIVDIGPFHGAAVGLHGHLRQGERRRLPHRLLPAGVQGDLGPRRGLDQLPARAGRALHRQHPPRPVRLRAHRPTCWPSGTVASRPSSTRTPTASPATSRPTREDAGRAAEPGAGTAAAGQGRPAGHAERQGPSSGPRRRRAGPSRRASTAATSTSRTSGSAAGSTCRCTCPVGSSPSATCTSRRATARSPSAGRSRCPATSTCTSTSSRAAWSATRQTMPFFKPGRVEPELLGVPHVRGHLRRGRPQLLHERDRRLPPGLPQRHQLPHAGDGLDLRAGLPVPRRGARRRPHRRRRRHPQQRGVARASRCRSSTATSCRPAPPSGPTDAPEELRMPLYDFSCPACGTFEARRDRGRPTDRGLPGARRPPGASTRCRAGGPRARCPPPRRPPGPGSTGPAAANPSSPARAGPPAAPRSAHH